MFELKGERGVEKSKNVVQVGVEVLELSSDCHRANPFQQSIVLNAHQRPPTCSPIHRNVHHMVEDDLSQHLPTLPEAPLSASVVEEVSKEEKVEVQEEDGASPRQESSVLKTVDEDTSWDQLNMEKESGSKQPPTIFSDKEYHRRLESFNPGAENIPHDMMRFDPTALERPAMEVLHATDTWMAQLPQTCVVWDTPSVVNEKEDEIQRYLKTKDIHSNRHSYVRERAKRLDGELESTFDHAMHGMDSNWPSYLRQREYLDNVLGRTPLTPKLPDERE